MKTPLSLLLMLNALVLPAVVTAQTDAEQTISGEISLGVGVLSDDSYRFGRYNGIVDQGVAPLFSLHLQTQPGWNSDDLRYAWFDIDYLGAESISARGEIGLVGKQRASVEFRKLNNFLYSETVSPFIGENTLQLPGTWQTTGNTTQNFINLSANLNSEDLFTQRNHWQFNFEKLFLSDELIDAGWDFDFNYRRETKKGRRAMAGTIGTNAGNARSAILTPPVDFETNNIELQLQKSGMHYHYGILYSGSYFNNDVEYVRWQNPFGSVAQWAGGVAYPNGNGQIGQEPNNTAQQLGLNFSWYFTKASLHVDASRGRMSQSETFLPYSVNTNLLINQALPSNDLSGAIDTSYANLRFAWRPMSPLNVTARYRFDDRDNKTPQAIFYPVTGDAEDQGTTADARINRPYSYTRQTLDVDANYRLSRGMSLKFGAGRDDTDRNFSEVNKTEETTVRGGLAISRWQAVNLSLNVSRAVRDSDAYIGNRPLLATHLPGTVAPTDFENHPLLRKYYLADRERNQMQLRADWLMANAINVGVNAAFNQDEYDDDYFGLHDATMLSLSFDAAYQIHDKLRATAFLARDSYDTEQAGRNFTNAPGQYMDPSRNWDVSSDDTFNNVGLNIEWQGLPTKFSFLPAAWQGNVDTGVELNYSRSLSDIQTTTGPSLSVTPLSDISTRLKSYRWYVQWHLPSTARIDFVLTHESYHSDDFGFAQVFPTSIDNVLTLGEMNPNYSINWFTLGYTLPF